MLSGGPSAGNYDVVVVGSGAAGMTAAIAAALRGLSVVVIERAECYGGTTAYSGGAIWIPGNRLLAEAGVTDSAERGREYLRATVGESIPAVRRDAYLRDGAAMVDELHERTRWMRWTHVTIPDYWPEAPGGVPQGRSVEAAIVDGRALGNELRTLRAPSAALDLKGLTIQAQDFVTLNMVAHEGGPRHRAEGRDVHRRPSRRRNGAVLDALRPAGEEPVPLPRHRSTPAVPAGVAARRDRPSGCGDRRAGPGHGAAGRPAGPDDRALQRLRPPRARRGLRSRRQCLRRLLGDSRLSNPSLAPLEQGPFYAVRLEAGDLGTSGGLAVDAHSRVLSEAGRIMPGLYAAGNSSAGVMGATYPGPGATIGAAMVSGYQAAIDIAHPAARDEQGATWPSRQQASV